MSESVTYRREGRIGHIILDRPEKLNAMTDAMLRRLHEVIVEFDEDEDAWVGIISGAGRAFCSGADVQGRQMRPVEELGRFGGVGGWQSFLPDYFFRLTNWKPIIAAVHGHVLGMGLRIALLAEFTVAAEGTKFCITETGRGLDGTVLWAHLDRRARSGFATDVAMTGRTWLAEEAIDVGAIDRLAPADKHVEVAIELAGAIAANPPLSVRAIVEARRAALEQLEYDRRHARPKGLHLSSDFQEALRAFVEKRSPKFEGR
jgi:enoyl-CoA hydratase/carnithine racemase